MVSEQIFESQEKIVRKVTPSGNGAHIFAPKEWMDEEVVVVRTSRFDIKKEILRALELHIEDIVSVFLFGSYARREQNEKSDIDVLVIANRSFKIKRKGLDIIVLSKDKIKKAIRMNPTLMYSAISEGVPIVNSSYLMSLKKEKISKSAFRKFVRFSKESLKSSKEIIELDKEQGLSYVSDSAVYSLFLRLRGLFIIDCLLKNIRYSNKLFRDWIIKKVSDLDYNSFYSVYASVRDDKKTIERISIKHGESLIELLDAEIKNKS